jgi:hypothetical protein
MATATNLFNPPPVFALPLSYRGDLAFTFIYKPQVVDGSNNPVLDGNGNPTFAVANYPTGATVTLWIESTPTPISVLAAISGSNAVFLIPNSTANTIGPLTPWEVVITYASGQNQVLCNGMTVRKDGSS